MVAPRPELTAAEYLAWEYFHGDVFAMAGGSSRAMDLPGAAPPPLDPK